MSIRRTALIVALTATLSCGLIGPGDAVVKQPKTLAGAVAAAQKAYGPRSVVQVDASSTAAQARHGVVDLSATYTAGGAVHQVWAYNGAVWRSLSQPSQESIPYPTALPGRLTICKGTSFTIVRTGPGARFPVRARITRNTTVAVTDFLLTLGTSGRLDGVGYYRIILKGRVAWVASYRVTTLADGCAGWKIYWGYTKHR